MKNKEENKLGTAPLGRLIISMAIPAVAAQLINVLYNIVDRIYIGRIPEIGEMALTGVGITFPIISIISAFAAFAGQGAAPIAARKLGQKDQEGAEKIIGTSTTLLLSFALALTLFFTLFKEQILFAFGASEHTFQYASDYIGIYLMGTVFVQLALGLNPFISAQGQAKIAMLSVCLGAGINILLDPILIFGLGLGVKGAAIATIVSQMCSTIWIVSFLRSKKSAIRIKKENIRIDKLMLTQIAALGISPFIMQSTESIVTVTLNTGLLKYGGDLYVGSMSILLSLMQLIIVPVNGMAYGIQPIISYNYGAGNTQRVISTYKRMLGLCLGGSLIMSVTLMTFPEVFTGMFTTGEELLSLTASVIPIYFMGITIFGIQMACQCTFLALGEAKISLFIALLRKVFLLTMLAKLLPMKFGVMGIYFAEPISDFISVTVVSIAFVRIFSRVIKEMRAAELENADKCCS